MKGPGGADDWHVVGAIVPNKYNRSDPCSQAVTSPSEGALYAVVYHRARDIVCGLTGCPRRAVN